MHQLLTPRRLRRLIQSFFLLASLWVGWRFFLFYQWATGASDAFTPRPGGVEGFLPISALLGLKHLLATARFDHVHPAGLTIFLAAIAMALLVRKGFCGYVCPVGLISNLLESLGRKLKLAKVPPKWLDRSLMAVKYGILLFFLWTVCWNMPAQAVEQFLNSPFNVVSDAKMLHFFLHPSMIALLVFGVLIICSVVLRNFWCRLLCPYGAFLGLLALCGPTTIRRDAATCIDCKKCTRGCPGGIPVHEKRDVRSPECVGCAECIGNCPVEGCLKVNVAGAGPIPWMSLALGAAGIFLLFYVLAHITGRWNAELPPQMLKRFYGMLIH